MGNSKFMEEAMNLAIEFVQKGWGGPFGAVITKDGKVVGRGQNRVLLTGCPVFHAEVTAIVDASAHLNPKALLGGDYGAGTILELIPREAGSPDPVAERAKMLKGCDIYVIGAPRIDHVYFVDTLKDTSAIGFDDAYQYEDFTKPWAQRRIAVTEAFEREMGLKAYKAWTDKKDCHAYRSSGRGCCCRRRGSVAMNKRLMSWLALSIFTILVGAVAPAQAQQACTALTITGHPSYPSVAWAAQGKIVGAAPTLVSGIAEKLGIKDVVSKDFGSWESAQAAARNGEADVIFGIYKTDARAGYLDFIASPFMTDPVAIVVRNGAGVAYAEWSDLKGRKGVTNAGESYGDKFDAFMAEELTVARAAGVDKAFAALLAGEADYMIIGLYPTRDEARRLGIADKIAFLPKELLSSAMYVAFSKKSKCAALQARFAADIKTAVDNGTVRQLLETVDKSPGR